MKPWQCPDCKLWIAWWVASHACRRQVKVYK